MNAGIPIAVSIPLLGFIWIVLAARLLMLHSTIADRRINIALAFAALCCLLRNRVAQAVIIEWSGSRVSAALLFQLSELAVIPTAGALFLVGYSWINDVEPRYLAGAVYSAVTVCTLATLALGLNARSHHVPLSIHSGWAVIAYSSSPIAAVAAIVFHDSLIYWFSIMIIIACVRELRQRPNRRAIAISAAMATVAIGVLGQTLSISIATLVAMTGRHNPYIHLLGTFDRFTVDIWTYIGAAVTAVPVVARILDALQLDKHSLRRKRLLPLWSDLTDACPEIVHLTRGEFVSNRSRYLLHRTVVEIRDCILILSRYAVHRQESVVREVAAQPALRQAVRLALAWSAKSHGQMPSTDFAAQQSAAGELLDETEELTQLADQWPRAKELAATISATPSHAASCKDGPRNPIVDSQVWIRSDRLRTKNLRR